MDTDDEKKPELPPEEPGNPENKLDKTGERDEKGLFLPGHDGMGGRPAGSVSITTIIKRKLQEAPPGQRKMLAELLADKILDKAYVDGNENLIKEVWHYVDGMPNQKVDFGVDKENIGELTSFLSAVAKKPHVEPVAAKTDDIGGGDVGAKAE